MTQEKELLTKSLHSAEFLLSELQELNSETENFIAALLEAKDNYFNSIEY